MLRTSCSYCADCAAPLLVLHEAPQLNPFSASPSHRDRSAAPSASSCLSAPTPPSVEWSSRNCLPSAKHSSCTHDNRLKEAIGSEVSCALHSPQSRGTDDTSTMKTDTADVNPACWGEGGSSSSLHGSFVLLSPLPGASCGYSQNIVLQDGLQVPGSDCLTEDHLRHEEPNSASASGGVTCQPLPVSLGAVSRDPGKRLAARLAEGEKWGDLGLDDSTLCEQCFSATMRALNEQLEQEKRLLLRYKRALRSLRRTKKKAQARDDKRKTRWERGSEEADQEHPPRESCDGQKTIFRSMHEDDARRPVHAAGQRGQSPRVASEDIRTGSSSTLVFPEDSKENGDWLVGRAGEDQRGDSSDSTDNASAAGFLTPREQPQDAPRVQSEGKERGVPECGKPLENGEAPEGVMPPHLVAPEALGNARGENKRASLLRELVAAAEEREEGHQEEKRLLYELLGLDLLHLQLCLLSTSRQDQVARQEESTAAMLRQRDYVRGQVRRLKRLNVMNDAFHIWTDEALPSINSCRIGRVAGPSCPSWAEINSGWGHMCLLVDVLFRKVYVHPTHYRLVPRGPYSYLVRKKDDSLLPLQGRGGEGGLSRFFYSNRRFDAATVAFLECVQELYEALTHFARQPWPPYAPPGVHTPLEPPELPFAIDGDRIGGFCIRLQLSQDERWTQAVKYLLIDLKWLLGYVEKVCVVLPSFA